MTETYVAFFVRGRRTQDPQEGNRLASNPPEGFPTEALAQALAAEMERSAEGRVACWVEKVETPMLYRTTVQVHGEEPWHPNGLRFPDVASATTYGYDIGSRWMLVRAFRVEQDQQDGTWVPVKGTEHRYDDKEVGT